MTEAKRPTDTEVNTWYRDPVTGEWTIAPRYPTC